MKNRIPTLLLLTMLAPWAAFASAPLVVNKATYSLTYPDGWVDNPFIPTGDTMSMVMQTELESMSWTYGQHHAQPVDADLYMHALTSAFTEGYVRTDSSSKVLGGKTFITSGWRDTSADADSMSRVRLYTYQQGNFLFISWTVYETPAGDAAVGQVESALATLSVKAAGIRRATATWNPRRDAAHARVDVLGRTWRGTEARPAAMPYFLRR